MFFRNLNIYFIKRGAIYLLFFFVLSGNSFAQKYNLKILSEKIKLPKKNYKKKYNDSLHIYSELHKYLNILFAKGYLSASFDSVCFKSSEVKAYLYLGEKYIISNIHLEKKIFNETKIKQKNVKNIPLNQENLENIYTKIIKFYENNGYPFVNLQNEQVKFNGKKVEIKLKISKNIPVKIKNIYIKGKNKTSKIFLKRYLSLFENDFYDESKISEISSKINELNFISEIKTPEIEFYGKNANIYLYIKNRKANLFNGIIGFIPEKENKNKLSFTGNLSIKLLNTFNKGEAISLNWIKPDKYSQRLKMNFSYPYFFGSPFGTSLNFGLEKQDTTYLTLNFKPELEYYFRNNDKISIFFKRKRTMILSTKYIDTTIFSNSVSSLFGFGFTTERLDYKYNPRRGYFLHTNIASGNRTINRQNKLNTEVKLFAEYYIPVYKNLVLKLAAKNEYIFSDSILFMNEMIKIGGFNSLRGFDEDAIYTSSYSAGSVELRYIFEKKSNFYVFFDFAGYTRKSAKENITDFPFGFGVGSNFETRAGIFSLSYALGKQQNNPVQMSNSKIHIGYINIF